MSSIPQNHFDENDLNVLYVPSQKLEVFCKIIFWINCILTVVNMCLSGLLLKISTVLQIALAITFFAVSLIDDGLYWYNAESERRKNSLQTAFGIRFSELVLAPGENRHFEPGENSQFQPGRNRQSVPGGCSQPRFGYRF